MGLPFPPGRLEGWLDSRPLFSAKPMFIHKFVSR
jgi:hypothetical protein